MVYIMLIDNHNHSEFSMDAEYSAYDMLVAAMKNKIEVFTITDHCDVDDFEKHRLDVAISRSVTAVERLQKGLSMKFLTGVELGQPLLNEKKADYVLENYDFDFVLGAIHTLKDCTDFYWMDYALMEVTEIEAVLQKYFIELRRLAEWNKTDSIAHISYPFRYIITPKLKRRFTIDIDRFDDLAADFLKVLINNDKALEQNTSSVRSSDDGYAINYKYMKMYYDLGGRLVTIGSDAHAPDMVGNNIAESYKTLKEIGFENVVYYEKRKPILVKI